MTLTSPDTHNQRTDLDLFLKEGVEIMCTVGGIGIDRTLADLAARPLGAHQRAKHGGRRDATRHPPGETTNSDPDSKAQAEPPPRPNPPAVGPNPDGLAAAGDATDHDRVGQESADPTGSGGPAGPIEPRALYWRAVLAALPDNRYHVAGLGAVLYAMACAHLDFTAKQLLDMIWFNLTDDQLAAIGFGRLRTPGRVADMRAVIPGGANLASHLPPAAVAKAWRTYWAEYNLLLPALHKLLAPIDDTPLRGKRGDRKRPTRAEVVKALATPEMKEIRARKMVVLNQILAASLAVMNRRRHGNDDHFSGVLIDDHGHRCVDETHLVTSLAQDIPINDASGNFGARKMVYGHRYDGAPSVVGATLLVTVASPDQPRDVPHLCVGFDLHHPTGGYGPGLLNALDHAEANGIRPVVADSETQVIISDGGYATVYGADRVHIVEHLLNRGYARIAKPAVDDKLLFEIGAKTNPDQTTTQPIYLHHGRLLSPGVGIEWLRTVDHIRETPKPYKHDEVRAHAAIDARLTAALMPTNGQPLIDIDRPRGGQPKDQPTTKRGRPRKPANVARLSVICPARKYLARCHLFDQFDHPGLADLLPLTGSPKDLDDDQRPGACTNPSAKMRVNIPAPAWHTLQYEMPGTWAWQDWFTGPRAAVENFNSILKSPTGPHQTLGAIQIRRQGLWGLLTTLNLCAANRRSMSAWDNKVIRNHGRIPAPPAKATRDERARILNKTINPTAP